MKVHVLEREQLVSAEPDEVFEFFSRARNLERITPPWLRFELLGPEPHAMSAGLEIDYRLRLHSIPIRWTSRIEAWEPGRAFVDRQVKGPYRMWHHRHEFENVTGGTLVRDLVHYAIRLGPIGELTNMAFVSRDLERIFDFRRQAVSEILSR